ncbi:hypothetical protein D018_1172A, partial [Vibrio parahaemolyticus VP2007-007]
MCNRSGC